MLWPVIPLFWIPVHCMPNVFRKLGLFTYGIILFTWLPLAWSLYLNRKAILHFAVPMGLFLNGIGALLLIAGTVLHTWTGKLLGIRGLIGLPEISRKGKGKLVTEGPFSVVRHPTYLAHTMIFLGVFLFTGNLAVGVITALDFLVINKVIIPLEERELFSRFGYGYVLYMRRVPRLFPSLKSLVKFS